MEILWLSYTKKQQKKQEINRDVLSCYIFGGNAMGKERIALFPLCVVGSVRVMVNLAR